jgi:hypothetical protein
LTGAWGQLSLTEIIIIIFTMGYMVFDIWRVFS